MKETIKRIGALLLVTCMILVIIPFTSLDVAAASGQPTQYSSEYNSGQRDVICTTLSGTSASSYYTGSYAYDNLSELSSSDNDRQYYSFTGLSVRKFYRQQTSACNDRKDHR